MALQDYNNTRRYTKYKRHVDNSEETINASDINKIQEDVVKQQLDSNSIKDTAFEERVYTIFNNNLYANAMFFDRFNNGDYVNMNKSSNTITINSQTHALTLKAGTSFGEMVSMTIESVHGAGVNLNDFFLVINEEVPIGAKTEYFIENVLGEMFPISPNKLKTPLHLSDDIEHGMRFHARLTANSRGEAPIINGYAILYWDAKIESDLKADTPDLARFQESELDADDGMTLLIRDRAQEDKIVRIEEPRDTVTLTYFWDTDDEAMYGRLWYVTTHWDYYQGHEVTQMHKLYYDDYRTSTGDIESVLKKIGQATEVGATITEDPYIYKEKLPIFTDILAEKVEVESRNQAIGYGGDEDI